MAIGPFRRIQRLQGAPGERPFPSVRLFSKPDCHLCEDAAALLDEVGRQLRFTWHRVDITTDSGLHERYRFSIPVIEVEGGATLPWPTTRERIRRALIAAGARA